MTPVGAAPRGRWQALLSQVILVLAVSAAILWLVDTVRANLALREISSGFDFLLNEAGFPINQHLIPYDERSTYARAFLVALLNMALVTAIAAALATVMGILIGTSRLARNWLLSRLALVFIETVRNVPTLLHIFFWYYVILSSLPTPRASLSFFDVAFLNNRGLYLPAVELDRGLGAALIGVAAAAVVVTMLSRRRQNPSAGGLPLSLTGGAIGLIVGANFGGWLLGTQVNWDVPQLEGFNFRNGLVLRPEFVALVVALSVYNAAFVAEIIRAGIQAVDQGQSDAAKALGLTARQRFNSIVLPQAMRLIVPPLTNQYLNLAKATSLGAAIAYPEIMQVLAGSALNQTGRAIEIMSIVLATYLVLSFLIALLLNWYNRKVMLVEL